jgi:hypothetical protein
MTVAYYWTECDACGVETEVDVYDETEIPQFCPMCGFSTKWGPLEGEDD